MVVRRNSSGIRRYRRGGGSTGLVLSAAVLAGAFLISRKAPPVEAAQPRYVAEYDVVQVPVPAQPVPAGMRLAEVPFEHVAFPKQQLPPGALLTLAGYEDAYSAAALPARLPLFPENLVRARERINPVIEQIPDGMRAITVQVDATSAVEGWAGTGAIVDVLLVQQEQTVVVAEQVKILSAERTVEPVEGESVPNVPSTATLLVTQEQALAISTAVPLGRLTFALRSPKDADNWRRRSFSSESLNSDLPAGEPPAVHGYAAVGDGAGKRNYILADGRWLRSQERPPGFLAGSEE